MTARRTRMGDQKRVARLLACAAAPLRPSTPDETALFQRAVLREIRSRAARGTDRAARPAPRLAPAAAFLSAALMIAAAGTAFRLDRIPSGRTSLADRAGVDQVASPAEIPFVLHEDLVGSRRGSIPRTTYVLEPAPIEGAVMRASL